MKSLFTSILLLLSVADKCFSQEPVVPNRRVNSYRETAIKLLVGGDLQQARIDTQKEFLRKYLEIGVHHTFTFSGPSDAEGMGTHGLSVEISLAGKNIYGFKYGAWLEARLVVFGLNVIYYTDFDHGNFKIRPEFGLGANPVKMTIGLNIPTVQNAQFKELQKSLVQLTLNILLKVKTLKREEH